MGDNAAIKYREKERQANKQTKLVFSVIYMSRRKREKLALSVREEVGGRSRVT